jgi:hypothetical protein
MPPAGFEPTIPASERPQIHAVDRATNGIGNLTLKWIKLMKLIEEVMQLLQF